jgi:hypothetical protein
MCVCIYIYIHIRERERERDIHIDIHIYIHTHTYTYIYRLVVGPTLVDLAKGPKPMTKKEEDLNADPEALRAAIQVVEGSKVEKVSNRKLVGRCAFLVRHVSCVVVFLLVPCQPRVLPRCVRVRVCVCVCACACACSKCSLCEAGEGESAGIG